MPASPRIVVLDDWQRSAASMAAWTSLRARVDFVHEAIGDRDRLVERLDGVASVATMRERTRFDAALLGRLPSLEMLAATGSARAMAFVDAPAAASLGIAIATTGDSEEPSPSSTAELTIGLMIAALRGIAQGDRDLRAGRWRQPAGERLHGKTLGIVGLGRIGREVAALARAFGMRTIAWGLTLDDARARAAGVERVGRDRLFTDADVVTLHLRLDEATRGLIGAADLARMKPTAWLVNTSRGPLVREDALLAALRERRIGGAALDVYDREPLPAGHPLASLDNVLLTPHLGYVVDDQMRLFYERDVENIAAWLAGTPIRLLEPAVLRVERARPALGSATR
jgi:phosphoglycerate dehydrogenase-like enzyme